MCILKYMFACALFSLLSQSTYSMEQFEWIPERANYHNFCDLSEDNPPTIEEVLRDTDTYQEIPATTLGHRKFKQIYYEERNTSEKKIEITYEFNSNGSFEGFSMYRFRKMPKEQLKQLNI